MSKELVLLGVYVHDALATAKHYATKLSMRELALHRVETERGVSDCVVMAGSDKPPWVAVFSGRGSESVAARLLGERPPGLHQLVYLTDEYDADLAWLRRRGLGFERLIPLDGTRFLRRASATLQELGMIVDLIETPPAELDETQWLRPIVDSLCQPPRLAPALAPVDRGLSLSSRTDSELPPSGSSCVLRAGDSLEAWQRQIEQHRWSGDCVAVRQGALDPELRVLLEEIHARGPDGYDRDVRAARRALSDAGLGARPGHTIGGVFPVLDSPIFMRRADAERVRRGAEQCARALKGFLADLYEGRPTPVGPSVLDTNPFDYVRADWSPPRPAGLAQFLVDIALDATTGRYVMLDESVDSGRCGLATLGPVRVGAARAHEAALRRTRAVAPEDAGPVMRKTVHAFARASAPQPTSVAMAFQREPPPHDLPDWEDLLLAELLAVPLVAEADLQVASDALYRVAADGTRARIDVLLHRRPASLYKLPAWSRLVRAGALSIVDPINSALCNDRALRASTGALIRRYVGEEPLVDMPETLPMLDPSARAAVLADLDRWVLKERGGKLGGRVFVGDALGAAERQALRANVEDDPQRWVAQARVRIATTLFFEASTRGVRVWEGRYTLHGYVAVADDVTALGLFASRVFPLGARAALGRQMLVADVVVCEGESRG